MCFMRCVIQHALSSDITRSRGLRQCAGVPTLYQHSCVSANMYVHVIVERLIFMHESSTGCGDKTVSLWDLRSGLAYKHSTAITTRSPASTAVLRCPCVPCVRHASPSSDSTHSYRSAQTPHAEFFLLHVASSASRVTRSCLRTRTVWLRYGTCAWWQRARISSRPACGKWHDG